MTNRALIPILVGALLLAGAAAQSEGERAEPRYNVLFIISDDLTATALSCYGNEVCKTPNIDRVAARGTRFTGAYCQGTFCGPSRASFMSGYYPHAIRMLGYRSPRPKIGDRATWAEHFKNNGYYSARVGKIFHMGVPGGIEKGTDGADDPRSWTERFNCQGPEWKAPGRGETLERNPRGEKPVMGGNTFVIVAADGDDAVHADGKAADKACELIAEHKGEQFFLGVGFVRPHVPFVAPASYFAPFPAKEMRLPEKVAGDWDDIPKAGINYKTSSNMQMDEVRQRKAMAGYYASVAYMDAQVGKVMAALRDAGLEEKTIVIFTSDHGYHLGEHDFWAKVSLHEESALVPLIISVPGKKPAVCRSFVELLDLYPTVSALCGLEVPSRLQGKDVTAMLDDPSHKVRDTAFCVNGKGFLLRDERWAYMQYGEDGKNGIELYDMSRDPQQYTNLATDPASKEVVAEFRSRLAAKLKAVRTNDLDLPPERRRQRRAVQPAPQTRPKSAAEKHARMALLSDVDAVVPGRRLSLGLSIRHDPGWHTYWRNPGTVGLATQVEWVLPEGCSAGPLQWPTPILTKMGAYTVWGYEGRATLLADIHVPSSFDSKGGEFVARAKVTFMACAKTCNPGHTELTIELPVRSSANVKQERRRRFSAVRRQQPQKLTDVWKLQVVRTGQSIKVVLTPRDSSGERKPNRRIRDVYFFGDDRTVSSDLSQEVRRLGQKLVLTLPCEEHTPAKGTRLRGMLHTTDGFLEDGATPSMIVDVPLPP